MRVRRDSDDLSTVVNGHWGEGETLEAPARRPEKAAAFSFCGRRAVAVKAADDLCRVVEALNTHAVAGIIKVFDAVNGR